MGLTDPHRSQALAHRYYRRRGLRPDIVVESFGGQVGGLGELVSGPPKPGGADIVEGDSVIPRVDFTFDASISNSNRDAARAREVFRLEAEDGHTAFVQFSDDRARV